jgi:penicillin G amidase
MRRPVLYSITAVIAIAAMLFGNNLKGLPSRSFPQTSGEVHLSGLDGPVDIYRDPNGIPHIYATTTHDLFYAQGYVHAQDRFFQMDFWRHIGSGRLSEMFGKSQLDTDIFLRRMGWARVAQQELDIMEPETKAVLTAYADGVNAYISGRDPQTISLEYAVMKLTNRGYTIEPWTPLHSLTWAKAMAWDLRGNMDEEGERVTLLKTLTLDQINQLYPDYNTNDFPVIVNHLPAEGQVLPSTADTAAVDWNIAASDGLVAQAAALKTRSEALNDLLGPGGPGAGSNNWVISGKLTATGKPLLANDPHLGPQMPSIWYEIGLHCIAKSEACPIEVTGFSFAGAPGVIIGHNDRIAWGFTNVGPDVQDIYIEKINPDNPDQYEVNGQWVDMQTVKETIKVAGGDPLEITVRYTRHGPILWEDPKDIDETRQTAGVGLPQVYRLALRWTALEPSNTFPAVWQMDKAQNWEEFRAAASLFDVPAQNFIYADVDGNIGYQTPGRIPIRASGDGRMWVPGWTDAHEWTGYIPYDELPRAYNPPEGFIATANNAVVGPGYPYLIGTDFDYGYRARRIVDLITHAPGPIDAAYIAKIQGDTLNPSVAFTLPPLLQLKLTDPHLAQARGLLENWDGQQTIDSSPAALYNAYLRHLLLNTFGDEMPEDLQPNGSSRWFTVLSGIMDQPDSPWWDDQKTDDVIETRDAIVARSFADGLAELEKLQGKDPAKWNWGKMHAITFKNQSFGESGIGPIEALFNRGPFPVGGGQNLVDATGWDATKGYQTDWLPSMRMIVDLSDLSQSQTVNTTGQSGHAYHPHYVDLADLWRTIQYHPMRWETGEIQKTAEGHLRLAP